jgi:hypothetical protein
MVEDGHLIQFPHPQSYERAIRLATRIGVVEVAGVGFGELVVEGVGAAEMDLDNRHRETGIAP